MLGVAVTFGAPAAPDVDGAGRGGGTARVRCDTNAFGIGSRAYVVLDFLLGALADHETSQKKWLDEQTKENC